MYISIVKIFIQRNFWTFKTTPPSNSHNEPNTYEKIERASLAASQNVIADVSQPFVQN